MPQHVIVILVCVVPCLTLAIAAAVSAFRQKPTHTGHVNTDVEVRYVKRRYESKRLMTNCESQYYDVIRRVLSHYECPLFVYPQVALVSIVDKIERSAYRNELFRVIDFVVCDDRHRPLAAIEVNDPSHLRKQRAYRDYKVASILQDAGIPLVKLWTGKGANEWYIEERLEEALRSKGDKSKYSKNTVV